MSYTDTIISVLKADTTFTELCTGGVYAFEHSGRKGLNRVQVLAAFKKTREANGGTLKPTVIVYEVAEMFDGQAVGPMLGYMSTVTPITGWIYAEGETGYDVITQIEQRMYQLLAFQKFPGMSQILWSSTPKNRREELLDDAALNMFQIRVHSVRHF